MSKKGFDMSLTLEVIQNGSFPFCVNSNLKSTNAKSVRIQLRSFCKPVLAMRAPGIEEQRRKRGEEKPTRSEHKREKKRRTEQAKNKSREGTKKRRREDEKRTRRKETKKIRRDDQDREGIACGLRPRMFNNKETHDLTKSHNETQQRKRSTFTALG